MTILSVLTMVLDQREQHMETVRSSLSVLLYPLHQIANLPRTGGGWLAEEFASRRDLQNENASLRAQQLLLQAELQKLEALQIENMRLRELLDSSLKVGERVLIAEIMAVDLNPFSRQVVINKGSLSDVYKGQPILDAEGVMGQVVDVTPLTSTAMLISDPSHALPVVVNRNGRRAVAVGTGNANLLDIPHLPNNADIEQGDLLVTSGLGGRFPDGYPVARVTVVEKDPRRRFARVQAEPTAKLDRSLEVLLVWQRPAPADVVETEQSAQEACDPEQSPCEAVSSEEENSG